MSARPSLLPSRLPLLLGLFALPISVDSAGPERPSTTVELHGGSGSFALITRGCGGQVLGAERIDFQDGGINVVHRFRVPMDLGVRLGWVELHESEPLDGVAKQHTDRSPSESVYLQPHMAIQAGPFHLGVGILATRGRLPDGRDGLDFKGSGHIRVGGDRLWVGAGILDGQPVYSGGGVVQMGVNVPLSRRLDGYAGIAGVPFEDTGAVFRLRGLSRHLYVDFGVRLGHSEGVSESALFAGLGVTLPH